MVHHIDTGYTERAIRRQYKSTYNNARRIAPVPWSLHLGTRGRRSAPPSTLTLLYPTPLTSLNHLNRLCRVVIDRGMVSATTDYAMVAFAMLVRALHFCETHQSPTYRARDDVVCL